ncbi:MAG: response regulator [Bacteroidales bacterium]|nr:response regulator [Bacteroidales bacterium]
MLYNWSNYTVLIAEDDPINFRYLQLLLEKRTGIQIVWAKNGREAYEKVINHSMVDMVLLDIQLPELNGLDVLKHIKKLYPDLPVFMQTANSWNNEEDDCYHAGCDGFFAKPLNIDYLFEQMDKFMAEYAEKRMVKQTIEE